MSRLRTPEDVLALERERKAIAQGSEDKAPNSALVQALVSVPSVDRELEPIVTRKELWSYYRMSLRDSFRSCEGIK